PRRRPAHRDPLRTIPHLRPHPPQHLRKRHIPLQRMLPQPLHRHLPPPHNRRRRHQIRRIRSLRLNRRRPTRPPIPPPPHPPPPSSTYSPSSAKLNIAAKNRIVVPEFPHVSRKLVTEGTGISRPRPTIATASPTSSTRISYPNACSARIICHVSSANKTPVKT